jgi:hypothetical protein
MEKKEREELVKRLDMIDGFPKWKVPCHSCQKGGMSMDMNGNEYTCDKCGGSEWVVNPELVKIFEQELSKAREEGWRNGERYHFLLERQEEVSLNEEEVEELNLLSRELSKLKDKE